jgi:hypothetical protein
MRTRLYLVLEAIRENRIIVRRVGTKEMKADGFTKRLDGSNFVQFRKEVLHLTESTGGRRIYLPQARIFFVLTKSGDGCSLL